jgi:hypothetical protein
MYDNMVAIMSKYRGKIKENPKINSINGTSFIDDNQLNFERNTVSLCKENYLLQFWQSSLKKSMDE